MMYQSLHDLIFSHSNTMAFVDNLEIWKANVVMHSLIWTSAHTSNIKRALIPTPILLISENGSYFIFVPFDLKVDVDVY